MTLVSTRPNGGNVIPTLSKSEQLEAILSLPRPGEDDVLAYYEHRIGGVCTEPRLMLLPLDDHLAHRGDGVFETVKYVNGKIYCFDEHLERMRRSAEGIYLAPPCPWEEIRSIALAVAAAGKEPLGQLRLLLGRGPGGFGIDPDESSVSSFYAVAYRFYPKNETWYKKGLRGFKTTIPAKQEYLARIKNANYLPNVLMIREARERKMDVPFCFTEEGYLAESAVANICLVNSQGDLEVPRFTNALPGTTIKRAMGLLEGKINIKMCSITEGDIRNAREIVMLGTGPDCVAVSSYEGHPIGSGEEGDVTAMLRALIRNDIEENGVPIPGMA